MAFKIGFTAENPIKDQNETTYTAQDAPSAPRKSVVQVEFSGRNMSLAYYNDMFDLKCGDRVYVDGKLEGQIGYVTDVNYNFKIKVSDYKRVIAVVDTNVHGQFFIADSHLVTFDRRALPRENAALWFKAPNNENEEFIFGSDDTTFSLNNPSNMNISPAAAERGHEYYTESRVRYICVDGTKGYAIVKGSKAYEVEFEYRDGEIGNLVCSCFCSNNCKHEFAALLQLRETLEIIEEHYADEYERTDYFAAIGKGSLFAFAIDGRETGSFVL